MKNLDLRPEIDELLINVNIGHIGPNQSFPNFGNFTKNANNILCNFGDSSEKYKKNFIKVFLNEKDNFNEFYDLELANNKIKKIAIGLYLDQTIPGYMKTYEFDFKKGDYISDKNSFNLLYLIYKNSKSLNKYGIRKYKFKEYIQRDTITEDILLLFKDIIEDFYTNEYDLSKHIYGSDNFIYKNYSDEEINILHEMGLVIKDYDESIDIFKLLPGFSLGYVINIEHKIKKNRKNKKKLKKGKIILDKYIFECFQYFYENTDSFRKYGIREEQLVDFLSKNKIGLKSGLKYIKVLVDYINSLDELFSTPYMDLLDRLRKFNYRYIGIKDGISIDSFEDYVDYTDGEYDKDDINSSNIINEYEDNNLELIFLGIFYNTDNLIHYTYYDSFNFYDSEFEEEGEKVFKSVEDYNNLLK